MRKWFPERLNIVSEGDSWFAYPPNWIVAGPPSNLIDHLSSWTRYKANFYTMASNGDEAVDMISGQQKHDLVEILRWHENHPGHKPVDLILFSGGGNDVVGENDFERFLLPYAAGHSARQCVNLERLQRKTKQIGLAYQELADLRDHYSPTTKIVTHTYDYPYASLVGGVFLGGLIKTQGWMKRFMDSEAVQIPDNLQTEVIRVFMDEMALVTRQVGETRTDFHVVDTIGTLCDRTEWLNEIHPTGEGFKALAKMMWPTLEQLFPKLAS